MRAREITILRTTANRNCEYEWGVHVAIFAKAAKLDETEVQATMQNPGHCWSDKEANLIRTVDQLCKTGTLEEDTRKTFQENWNVEEQLEILALVGTYNTISFVANVAQLSTEPFAARMPTWRAETVNE